MPILAQYWWYNELVAHALNGPISPIACLSKTSLRSPYGEGKTT
jgi:hypothetical protein